MDTIATKLAVLTQEQDALQNELQTSTPANTTSINSALEQALGDTLTLAKFLHGNFDARDVDEGQQTHLLDTIMNSFQDLKNKSEAAYWNISSIQEKSLELRDAKLGPLTQEVDELIKSTKTKTMDNQRTMDNTSSTIAVLLASHSQAQSNLETLRSRKRSAEQAALAADIGISILIPIWGIITAADHSKAPSAVLSIQADIEAAQRSIAGLENGISTSQDQLKQLVAMQNQLQTEQSQLEMLSSKLPTQRSDIQHNVDLINAMQQPLLKLKETSSDLYGRVGRLNNDALLVGHSSLTKKEFVTAILDLCALACIDVSTAVQVRGIRDEIVDGYSGQSLPSEFSGKLAEIEGKLHEMDKSPTESVVMASVVRIIE